METEMKEFKPGDRVRLQSGGPLMTVLDVGKHTGTVWCRWPVSNDFRETSFPTEAITSAAMYPLPSPT